MYYVIKIWDFLTLLPSRVLRTYVVNFICQKVQSFQADSEYLGEIDTKKENLNFFFQCLALP